MMILVFAVKSPRDVEKFVKFQLCLFAFVIRLWWMLFVECGSPRTWTSRTNERKRSDANKVSKDYLFSKWSFHFFSKTRIVIFLCAFPTSKRVRRISNMIRANSIWIPWILNYILSGFFFGCKTWNVFQCSQRWIKTRFGEQCVIMVHSFRYLYFIKLRIYQR